MSHKKHKAKCAKLNPTKIHKKCVPIHNRKHGPLPMLNREYY